MVINMTNQKTLILIDGHALAYRMFFALERTGMKTSNNLHTWAVYGFFRTIFDLLDKIQPDAIAVSFDCGRQTFRTEAYPEYKAHRQSMPDSLGEQLGLITEGVKALDIPIYSLEGYEADDVIGTIVREASELNHKSYILTGDRDAFQLVDKEGLVKVLIPQKGELIEYGRDKVFERMGVWPEQVVDLKALSGDTSDNIPGVKGIGDKTAIKLLEEFNTVDNLLENINNVKSKSQREKLEQDKEMAVKSKFLATIDRNVPIDFDFEHTHLTMPDVEKLADFLRKTEFFNFLRNMPTLLKPFNNGAEPVISKDTLALRKHSAPQPQKAQAQLSLFGIEEQAEEISETVETSEIIEQVEEFDDLEVETQIIDTQEALDKLISELEKHQIFSLDTETTSIDTLEAELVGISIGWNDRVKAENNRPLIDKSLKTKTQTAYIPVGHKEGQQLEIEEVLNKLKPLLEDKNKGKVLQNAKYEINILKNYNIKLNGIILDTMLASYVKNPTHKHGLKALAMSYLGFSMKEIEELIGKGKTAITMDLVNIKDAADYACADAFATLELGIFFAQNIAKEEEKVLYDIEIPLVTVLADMERNGVSIDTEYLNELATEIQGNLDVIEAKIYAIAGETFNVNSPKQVGDVLFEKMQLPAKGMTKTKTGYSTSAKVLELLAVDYPIAQLLLQQRHYSKIKSTYIDALPELISKKDNRIHTSYNQTVTTTGRLSSSNPNLQNIPIRTEIGNRIRAAFVPQDKEHFAILSADYSQIELRLLAHFSKDSALTEAFLHDIDVHTATASKVFDVPLEDVTKEMRRKAKAVNFGIIYGQTSYGLSEAIGITPKEAKEFILKYFETYPQIKEYMENVKAEAHEKGYVETMFGRKRYLGDELSSRNKMIREFAERAAINAPLQGTAADLVKLAMIKLGEELKKSDFKTKMILQVHDELVLEVPKNELKEIEALVKKCMELGQPLSVPLSVDIHCGTSWMEGSEDTMPVYE